MDYQQEYVDAGTERLGLHVYPEPDRPDAPLVVLWPAMGTPARFYRRFAAELISHGVAVAVVDLRGTGTSTPQPSRASLYGYAELAGDVDTVLAALAPRRHGRRTVLLGHSLGGQACLLHLALTGDASVDGVALVAVGLPYWRGYQGGRKYLVLPYSQGIGLTAAALRVWPGWTFGGRQSAGVIRDWAYTARRGRFPRRLLAGSGGTDVETALSTVTTPVLAVSVEGDPFTPGSTLDALCAKLTKAPIDRVVYTAAEAGARLDHFRWVKAGGPLAARIAAFAEAAEPPRKA